MAVSSFTWMDHRADDADRVREALRAFDEQGMVDPLGFGIVRDAFSETLFPGLSTVQTRARYFLFVPWIYQLVDAEGPPPGQARDRARELELDLIASLVAGRDDAEGIIGRVSKRKLKQLPSFIYWGGLGQFEIRRFSGTRTDYLSTIAERGRLTSRSRDEAEESVSSPWHSSLPDPPDDLLEETTIGLSPADAAFLSDRILASVPESYLAFLVRDGSADQVADVPWTHPLAPTAPPKIAERLRHAELFSLVSHGAGLRYNADLSSLLVEDGGESLATDFAALLDDWIDEMRARTAELAQWNQTEFWLTVEDGAGRVPKGARDFVEWWLALVTNDPAAAKTAPEVGDVLREREALLKKARAKLANRRARELAPTAQGDARMAFRWQTAQRIIRDIHEGLEADAQSA